MLPEDGRARLLPGGQRSNALTEHLLNAGEAAALLGVKKSWVLAQARADRIPHVRLGRYRLFRRESLEEWVSGLERGPLGMRAGRGEAARRFEP